MPIYEYCCPECGTMEIIQKITENTLTECPECAKAGKHSQIEKLISKSAFHLKGSGWYKTDYTSGSSSSGGSSTGSSKADKKSDSVEKKADKKVPKAETTTSTAA